MKKPTDRGTNMTGAATAPREAPKTAQGAQEGSPDVHGDFHARHWARHTEYAVEPIGTMPPPASMKEMAKGAMETLKGHAPAVLVDKLGERLAFERTGTRLYELLLVKLAAYGTWQGGPTEDRLREIRDEEERHMHMVTEAIRQLGADPTAVTPCADVSAVASQGVHHVIADPRTTLAQALDAILIAELADNDAWAMLIDLVEGFGKADLAERFRVAQTHEIEHLDSVRGWLMAWLEQESGTER